MKNKFLISLFLFCSSMAFSQQDSLPLSLDNLIPGGKTYEQYRPKMLKNVTFHNNRVVYAQGDSVYELVTDGKKSIVLFDLQTLNSSLDSVTFKNLPSISFPYEKQEIAELQYGANIYLYNFDTKKILYRFLLPDSAENSDFSPVSEMLAYTVGNNLYIMDNNGRSTAVTHETNPGVVCGQAVHRNEFGIMKGTFWSPNGNLLAFYRMDQSMVSDYPLVDASKRVAQVHWIKYPMAGMTSHQVTVGVYNPQTQKTVFLKTGLPKDKYLTNVAWSPDEKSIYIAELNRGQDTMQLKRYNAENGELERLLFTETNPKYVEPEHPVYFLKNKPNEFLWLSRRSGYNHFYLYNTDGKLLKQVTSGKWEIVDFVGFGEKGKWALYTSDEASPVDQLLYKVNLQTDKRVALSNELGIHRAILSADGSRAVDVYSSEHNPGTEALVNVPKSSEYVFYQAKNPFENKALPQICMGKIKAADGITDLYYRLVKPLNFDSTKKYPVVVYVYGGPHSQMVDDSWMDKVRGWDIYMAENGYLVFTLDNRGTSYRGLKFENVTFRHLGVVETEDQMCGVHFLKSLPYVDSTRIGVHGWSFGGFMTLNLMLRHPETFKVGVAGGPVTDWKYYEVMYGERYMDTPQENPEGYEESNMIDKAGNLQGRLLIIHDDQDETVVPQHSIQFLRSAIEHGTHPDFFVYPGHKHNVRGIQRVHLHETISRYFDDFLKNKK